MHKLKKENFKHVFFIESFGVKIGFSTNSAKTTAAVKQSVRVYLADCFVEIEETVTEHNFFLFEHCNGRYTLYKNDAKLLSVKRRDFTADGVASQIRITVAEFAPDLVFIHAGVVGLKGKAVIMPGRSFRGKTSLTLSLVKSGALYYSDEYAILDADGFLYPFPKMLSVRGMVDDYRQTDYPVEHFGGIAGTEKIRVGMVLLCEYEKKAHWNPQILSPLQGMMEAIRHTVPIRQKPHFTLQVLNKIAPEVIFVKSKRGDVSSSVKKIHQFIESRL